MLYRLGGLVICISISVGVLLSSSLSHADLRDAISIAEGRSLKDESHYTKLLEDNKIKLEEHAARNQQIVENANQAFADNAKRIQKDCNGDQAGLIGQITENQEVLALQSNQSSTDGLIICVSFSMPKEMLKSYLEQAELYGGRLVIRGLINNSFKETVKALVLDEKRALKVEVNPKIFKEFNVTSVPTLLVIDKAKGVYDRFTGAVSVKYALDEIEKNGDTKGKEITAKTGSNNSGGKK